MLIKDSQQSILFPNLIHLYLVDLRDLRAVISDSLQPTMTPGNYIFFSSLTQLHFVQCSRIKKLLTPPPLPCLTHVKAIRVQECEELKEIIAIEDDDHDNPILNLPKLLRLHLQILPQLNSLCGVKWTMKCDSLLYLVISECPKLERIPMELHIPPNHYQEELPVPSSLLDVSISSVPGWSDTEWRKRKSRQR